ncbi:MAG: phosphatidate cytidylyltransferase [Bacteroidetes bacterium]|nr:phosphatidate cytidylyltransferase [Bacteroidota bacterium]
MALNTQTLITRTLSAVVYVILLLGSLLISYYTAYLFFGIVAIVGFNEYLNLLRVKGIVASKVIGNFCAVLTYLTFFNFDTLFANSLKFNPFIFLSIIPLVLIKKAIFTKKENSFISSLLALGGILYVVIPLGLISKLVFMNLNGLPTVTYNCLIVISVIVIIWVNDTFAYLGGSLLGKRKLMERISPGKTIEGTVIGVIFGAVAGFFINKLFFLGEYTVVWVVLGTFISILATIGDLAESLFKRQAGVKDSGTIMPGHGGVLDRFDSILFTMPIVYLILSIKL